MSVVTFGEIMMRLATPGRLRFSQAKELELLRRRRGQRRGFAGAVRP